MQIIIKTEIRTISDDTGEMISEEVASLHFKNVICKDSDISEMAAKLVTARDAIKRIRDNLRKAA